MRMIVYAAVLGLAVAAQANPQAPPDEQEVRRRLGRWLQEDTTAPGAEMLQLEAQLREDPGNLDVRTRLIHYYYSTSRRADRLRHVFWLIENNPEAEVLAAHQAGFSRTATAALSTPADCDRAEELWRRQMERADLSPAALGNAAWFFTFNGKPEVALEALDRAQRAAPQEARWHREKAKLLVVAVTSELFRSSVDAGHSADGAFGPTARRILLESADQELVSLASARLTADIERMRRAGSVGIDDLAQFAHVLSLRVNGDRGVQYEEDWPDEPARLISRNEPRYPGLARAARLQGAATFSVTVERDGRTSAVTPQSGHPVLLEAAMEAARSWVYEPALLKGQPVRSRIWHEQTFRLDPLARPLRDTPGTIRVGMSEQASRLLKGERVKFPEAARGTSYVGKVILDALIGADGRVADLRHVDGDLVLAAAAIDTIRQWEYAPAMVDGQPVAVETRIELTYHLE